LIAYFICYLTTIIFGKQEGGHTTTQFFNALQLFSSLNRNSFRFCKHCVYILNISYFSELKWRAFSIQLIRFIPYLFLDFFAISLAKRQSLSSDPWGQGTWSGFVSLPHLRIELGLANALKTIWVAYLDLILSTFWYIKKLNILWNNTKRSYRLPFKFKISLAL